MQPLFKQLPPLHTLTFFEAAARYGSFTLAADELCVTQSAVSKQIRMLEENLGCKLFHRMRRQVILTNTGQEFHESIRGVLHQLADSSGRIRSQETCQNLTIVATVAVAHYWLFPRIVRFNIEHPEININIFATDEINEDICRKSDLGILYGSGSFSSSIQSEYLFRERIYPICSPSLDLPTIRHASDLLKVRTINLDPQKWRWVTWKDWFNKFGLEYRIPTNAPVFNQVPLAINAAIKGLGVTLAWEFMVGELLDQGYLKLPCNHHIETGMADYLVHDSSRSLSATAEIFHNWLIKDVSYNSN